MFYLSDKYGITTVADVWNSLSGSVKAIGTAITSAWPSIKEFLGATWNVLKPVAVEPWKVLGDAISLIATGISDAIGIINDFLGINWASILGQDVVDIWGEFASSVTEAVSELGSLSPILIGLGAAIVAFRLMVMAANIPSLFSNILASIEPLFAALAAHPFFAVAAAIFGLAAALLSAYRNNEKFRAAVDKAFEAAKIDSK